MSSAGEMRRVLVTGATGFIGYEVARQRVGASALEAVSRMRRRPTLFTVDTVRGWLLNLPVEPGLLWKDLGLEPRYGTINTGLPASLDDAVACRWLHPVADRSRG